MDFTISLSPSKFVDVSSTRVRFRDTFKETMIVLNEEQWKKLKSGMTELHSAVTTKGENIRDEILLELDLGGLYYARARYYRTVPLIDIRKYFIDNRGERMTSTHGVSMIPMTFLNLMDNVGLLDMYMKYDALMYLTLPERDLMDCVVEIGRRMVNNRVRAICPGCQVGSFSQKQHDVCLHQSWADQINLTFSFIMENLDQDIIEKVFDAYMETDALNFLIPKIVKRLEDDLSPVFKSMLIEGKVNHDIYNIADKFMEYH